jgi:uncharacterized coiled-coil protein SlyX
MAKGLDLDAAFMDFEKRLDDKLDARLAELRSESARELGSEERLREAGREETVELADDELGALRESYRRQEEELRMLTERIFHLEERINAKDLEDDFWSKKGPEGF